MSMLLISSRAIRKNLYQSLLQCCSTTSLSDPVAKIGTNFYSGLVFVFILFLIFTAVAGSDMFVGLYYGHVLKADTMVNAIPIIQLQLYVNPVLYYLVPPAILYAIVRRGETSREQLSADYHRLRKLLRHEFFHLEKTEDLRFNKALQYSIENNIVTDTDTFRPGSDETLQYLLQWTILPAFTTLATCADVMMQCKKCSHVKLLKTVQERVESGRCHPYCLSLESAANCIQGLVLYGALARHKTEKETAYEINPEKIEDCHSLISSVLPKMTPDFGSSNSVISTNSCKSKL